MLRPASLCCSLRWCWSCPPACGITPYVFSLTLCCLPPSSPFLVSVFLVVRTFSRISQKLDSDVVFRKGKVHQSFFGRLTTRLAICHPLRSEMQAVASVAAISGASNVFVRGCAAAALASAFAYLFALDVGISAAAAIVYECTLVLECAILSSGFFAFGFNISAAAAFSDAVTLVSGSACLSVAVFCIAFATAAAWSASFPVPLFSAGSGRSLGRGVFWDFGCVSAVTLRWCNNFFLGFLITWTFSRMLRPLVKLFAIGGTTVLSAVTTARGSRFACGAQATPRVDVDVTLGHGGHGVPHPLLLQVSGTHDHPVKTSGRFQVFVKGLAGHTLVIAGCSGDMLVGDFMELVAMREGVPVACFYLVGAGSKALRSGDDSL